MPKTRRRSEKAARRKVASAELAFADNRVCQALHGPGGANLASIERRLGVKLSSRGTRHFLRGETLAVALAERILAELYNLASLGHSIGEAEVIQAIELLSQGEGRLVEVLADGGDVLSTPRKTVRPKTAGQRKYIENIRAHDLTFGIGPAGTGKTYLAVVMAVQALHRQQVKRIVLARPAVEAGEKLGFLPGDMAEKVNPYLRPLRDALDEMLGPERAFQLVQHGVIEIAPLAFMRGRTLQDAFVILDEAQNTTPEQMKMFLTRIGFGSKVVVTGDVTQSDLPQTVRSGLMHAQKILSGVEGVGFSLLTKADVVRHPLVARIIHAYEHG